MAITKHKIFLLPIVNGEIDLTNKVDAVINTFLSDENIVYLSHSITTISKNEYTTITNFNKQIIKQNPDMDKFFKYKIINTFCVVSLVYKDLKDTAQDVSSLTKKTKEVVRQNVESGKKLPKPEINKKQK